MEKPFVIHPFLFAVFPVLFLLSHNVEQVFYYDILLPLLLTLGLAVLGFLLSRFIFRNGKKAAVIASVSLLLFFSYGHIYDLIEGWQVGGYAVGRHRYLLPAWGILLVAAVYLLMRSRSRLDVLTRGLNTVSLCLVVFSLLNIGLYGIRTTGPQGENRDAKGRATDTAAPIVSTGLPDIYYVVLDGYANAKTLKTIYGFDNRPFTEHLTHRGFYVVPEGRSNYPITFLSLASSLNMEYVNYLGPMLGEESTDRTIPYQMIADSRVMTFLRSKGYQFIHFSSGWGATDQNQFADLDIRCSVQNEFTVVLLQTTMLRPLGFQTYLANEARERVLCTFSRLAKLREIEGPKFVFAHVLPPHPPYLFGKDGEPVSTSELAMSGHVWEDKESYLNQLVFINKKIETLLDEILSNSEPAPIIILQADHGTASTFYDANGSGWDQPTANMLEERTAILNAYHLPGDCSDCLYDSITPVNTFRLVFDCYFETEHGLLDDRIHFCNYEEPYRLVDVTNTVTGN